MDWNKYIREAEDDLTKEIFLALMELTPSQLHELWTIVKEGDWKNDKRTTA